MPTKSGQNDSDTSTPRGNGDAIFLATVRRKIDLYIVPLMFAAYTMSYLDELATNYAAVMSLPEDLHLKGDDFSHAGTAFYTTYFVAAIQNSRHIWLIQSEH